MPYRLTRGQKLVPGDPRHGTRWSTREEKNVAARALEDLEANRNVIILVPAPDQHFVGQKVRVQESKNPKWYIEFGLPFWRSKRSFQLKRSRVLKALKRVCVVGIVRRNGLEVKLLEALMPVEVERS